MQGLCCPGASSTQRLRIRQVGHYVFVAVMAVIVVRAGVGRGGRNSGRCGCGSGRCGERGGVYYCHNLQVIPLRNYRRCLREVTGCCRNKDLPSQPPYLYLHLHP